MTDARFAASILKAAGIPKDPDARRPGDLAESRLLDGEEFCAALRPLVAFLRLGFSAGGKRPSRLFFETILGYGKQGLLALLSGFEDSGAEIDANLGKVLARVVQDAQRQNCIVWDLSGWKPGTIDREKERLGIYLPLALAERARRVAFGSRSSMSALVESAVTREVERLEAAGLSVERPAVEEPAPKVSLPSTASPFGSGTIPLPAGVIFKKHAVEAAKGKL